MTWVRANRARLVAACLILCQAWIAAGRPRGQKTIGSYENWAGVIGGILETAGIPGFLGNLEEMMAAADTEGGAWGVFVSGWWDRFGTAEVKSGDLYDIAVDSEPPLPLGPGNEKSQRTRLGKALGRMRDRVFRVAERDVRLTAVGVEHKAQLWRLALVGERGERFSTLTHARTRAHVKEEPEKPSPPSPRSPEAEKSETYAGERAGERLSSPSPPSRTTSGRIRAPWELPPEPPPPPPDTVRKKLPRSPVFKDKELPHWLAEIME
jgi:hypothetical protein